MIPLPCDTCRMRQSCGGRDLMARAALFAWLDSRRAECDDYEPEWFHGLEGVLV